MCSEWDRGPYGVSMTLLRPNMAVRTWPTTRRKYCDGVGRVYVTLPDVTYSYFGKSFYNISLALRKRVFQPRRISADSMWKQ